jgi:hypothetical protein
MIKMAFGNIVARLTIRQAVADLSVTMSKTAPKRVAI